MSDIPVNIVVRFSNSHDCNRACRRSRPSWEGTAGRWQAWEEHKVKRYSLASPKALEHALKGCPT